jgi:hypothetical protein
MHTKYDQGQTLRSLFSSSLVNLGLHHHRLRYGAADHRNVVVPPVVIRSPIGLPMFNCCGRQDVGNGLLLDG